MMLKKFLVVDRSVTADTSLLNKVKDWIDPSQSHAFHVFYICMNLHNKVLRQKKVI